METANQNWTNFLECSHYLLPGYKVKFVQYCNLSGKIGIVTRQLRKNYSIQVDGKNYRCSPKLIASFIKSSPISGNNSTPLVGPTHKIITSGEAMREEVIKGDVILMYRNGPFDVVKFIEYHGSNKCRCLVISGRSAGKIMRFHCDWYVQKLDASRIYV